MNSLKQAREHIQSVDRRMAALFEERMQAVSDVAAYKQAHGLPILDERREAEVIERGCALIGDELLRSYYVTFLQQVMRVSRSYQARLLQGMQVAYSGTEGAFAHLAARKLYPTARLCAYPDFEAAYRAVADGSCDAAVLPIENSTGGEVGRVSDLMLSGSLYVNAVTELSITQDLLGLKGAHTDDIREVISHPQALSQCASFLREKGYATREFENTALAAKHVAELGDPTVAAIASAQAAEIFGLEVLARNINESRINTTRFAAFSRVAHRPAPNESDVRSLLLFSVRNEAGALAKAIGIIGQHGFNMCTLRSRPIKETLWEYYFYVEVEGDLGGPEGEQMLSELATYCDRLKTVGTFLHTEGDAPSQKETP